MKQLSYIAYGLERGSKVLALHIADPNSVSGNYCVTQNDA